MMFIDYIWANAQILLANLRVLYTPLQNMHKLAIYMYKFRIDLEFSNGSSQTKTSSKVLHLLKIKIDYGLIYIAPNQ